MGLHIKSIDSEHIHDLYSEDVIVSFNGIQTSIDTMEDLKCKDALLVVDVTIANHPRDVVT